jgi:hypothetical protein
LGTPLISALFWLLHFLLPHMLVSSPLVSYYLWNEAITLIGTQTALIYYLIPVLVEYWLLFFKPSHCFDSNY